MKDRNHVLLKKISAIVLVFAIFLSMTACVGSYKYERQTKEIERTVLGVDVSGRYQGTIDWQQLGASGIGFAMVRVGNRGSVSGKINEDSNARFNLQEGNRAGIPMGVYFYSTAISEEEAVEEATWVAELIARYSITYPVAFDYEGYTDSEARHSHLSNKERTNIALAFLKAIEALGYEGMFYGSKNEIAKYWDISRIEKNYKVWVAQYPVEPYPTSPESSYEGPHAMWQYSCEGQVLGIAEPVDLNVAYFAYDGMEPAHDSTPPEEAKADAEAMMNFTDADEMVTAKNETNLRDIPSQGPESTVLDKLYAGEYAHLIATSESGWCKLVFEGNTYYAHSGFLTTGEEDEASSSLSPGDDPDGDGIVTQFAPVNKRVTAKEKTNLRTIPSATRSDSEVRFTILKGEMVSCIGESTNGWSKLVYQGETLYAISDYLMELDGFALAKEADKQDIGMEFRAVDDMVTPPKAVNLRTKPNSSSDVLYKILEGTVILRFGINESLGWSRVMYDGKILYCSTNLIEEVE